MKNFYSKSRKLILVIFLGLYYNTIEKFTIFIVTDVVTTILLSSILLPLPFATSKYINISNIDNSTNNNTNNINSNIDLTSLFTKKFIENSTIEEQYENIDDDTIKYQKNQFNYNNKKIRNRYKRWWPTITTTTTNNNIKSGNNKIKKNESTIELAARINNNSTRSNNGKYQLNYYYEEQKPLIIIPSESGPISIQDYTGTRKSLTQKLSGDGVLMNSDSADSNNNNFYDNSEYESRNKYVLTTSTESPSLGISDLSSKEMNEYDDDYRNDDDDDDNVNGDYDRQKYNDEIENDNENNNYDDNKPNLSSYMETAKNVWDIFTAINAAWSAISQKQQPDNNQNSKKFHEIPIESTTNYQQYSNDDEETERSKRNTNYTNGNFFSKSIETNMNAVSDMNTDIHSSTDMAIAEGRYIKGDPLKGYYDFVITEGSYKFWAAFQFATAILIIYSTFAAIYYSKVNPLVGDYDYVDYLGGGRSLSNNDVDYDTDFIDTPYSESRPKSSLSLPNDDNNNSKKSKSFLSTILETATGNTSGDLIPRLGHTLKFILDAIDKIPQ